VARNRQREAADTIMTLFADFHFIRPWWLLALVLLPLAGLAWRHVRGEAGNWKAMVDEHLLHHLVDTTLEPSRSGGVWLAGLVWLLACIALAGPAWEREPMPLYRNQAARILAIELAPTMLAGDIKPTRLERARYKLNDILESSRDMQTALIGYSGDAFVAAPLTDDVNTVRNLIDALDPGVMPVVGNAPERAIAEALKLMKQAGLKQAELILLADSSSKKALAAARSASSEGLRISVLGVGSGSGAPVPLPQGGFLQDAKGNIVLPRLDESALRALASAGGGRYAGMTVDRSDLGSLLGSDASRQDSAELDRGRALSDRFRDRGPWLLILLLPIAVFGFRRGWLMILALTFIVPSAPAQAFEFTDLWLRPDQQAARALARGDAKHAQALAKDPALRGSAAYRAEDYAAASEAWAKADGADALYNQGNALAKAGSYEEAITAYQQALDMNPKLEDAQTNKKAVEDWLKQQQSKDQKNQQDKDKQQPGQNGKQDQQQSGKQQDKQDQQQGEDGQQKSQDPQQGQDGSKDQQEQKPQSDQQQDPTKKDGEDQSRDDKGDQQKGSQAESGDDQKNPVDAQKSAAEQARDQQQRDQQQKQLSKAIDQALDENKDGKQSRAAAASPEDEASREQQQALQQWLQRVPDDPGGLLRRKFQLEYDRRQHDEGGD
jgi:Ca-activated chloride channel homolog